MRQLWFCWLVLMTLTAAASPSRAGDLERTYCRDLAHYFGVRSTTIRDALATGVPLEELPATLTVARTSGELPSAVAALRVEGHSWMQILGNRSLTAEVFFFRMDSAPLPPSRESQVGRYRKVPRNKWATLALLDDEAVGLANVRFISEITEVPAAGVFELTAGAREYPEVLALVREGGDRAHAEARPVAQTGDITQARTSINK